MILLKCDCRCIYAIQYRKQSASWLVTYIITSSLVICEVLISVYFLHSYFCTTFIYTHIFKHGISSVTFPSQCITYSGRYSVWASWWLNQRRCRKSIQTCIREVLDSNLCRHRLSWIRFILILLSPSKQLQGDYLGYIMINSFQILCNSSNILPSEAT